jgi:hypothetical protein
MAIAGMTGAVYVSDVNTAPISFTDEPCTGDVTRKRFQIDDTSLRYWSPNTVTVEVEGIAVTSGFILESVGGIVVFEEARDIYDEVTVSGKALTLAQAGGFFNWNLDGDGEDVDATTFASEGWKEFVRTLKGWSGSAEAYWGDTQFFDSLGKTVVMQLFLGSGEDKTCLEGLAIINGDGVETPVEGLVQETVDFTGTGPLYIREG